MTKLKYMLALFFSLFIVAVVACNPSQTDISATATQIASDIFATQTTEATLAPPTKTPTPTPAVTPMVGDTVIGSQWQVRVVTAKTDVEFATYSFPPNSTNQMAIITLEYTYMGTEAVRWSPQGVILVHVGERLQGWAKRPRLYRSEVSPALTDFDKDPLFILARPDIVEMATFVYEFPGEFSDFLLYFPETPAISIHLESESN